MAEHKQPIEPGEPPPGAPLRRALAALHKEALFIPREVDDTVLAGARPELARLRARHSRGRMAKWLALAACIVALGALVRLWLPSGGPRPFAREDLNRDGRVDILDAFQLARDIKAGRARKATEDFNGDGRVDAADVQILARRAVSLGKGGHS